MKHDTSDAGPSALAVARALIGVNWPASRDELVEHLAHHGAHPHVLAHLNSLAADRRFRDKDELIGALHDTTNRL